MTLINPKIKIKVIGVGGSGINALARMARCQIQGIELVAVNTDQQDLLKARADVKLRIGRQTTKGLGAGMDPEVGKQSALENKADIAAVLEGADMIFITYGAGGGTGTGAGPIIARLAREMNILTLAVVTKPFSFEGKTRLRIAEEGIKKLKEHIDTIIIISNDNLISAIDDKTSLINAFWICDDTLRQAVQGISDLILLPGIININFADVKMIMQNAGSALFGIGRAEGEGRAEKAALSAINSPLLGVSIKGAKGILFNISGSKDISLSEINAAARVITREASPQAKIIFGAVQDNKIKPNAIKITVIATGF